MYARAGAPPSPGAAPEKDSCRPAPAASYYLVTALLGPLLGPLLDPAAERVVT